MDNDDLQKYSTKQLVNELMKREGVSNLDIAPYVKYQILSENAKIEDDGPAILLVIID